MLLYEYLVALGFTALVLQSLVLHETMREFTYHYHGGQNGNFISSVICIERKYILKGL